VVGDDDVDVELVDDDDDDLGEMEISHKHSPTTSPEALWVTESIAMAR
jgi:hypothetical protein